MRRRLITYVLLVAAAAVGIWWFTRDTSDRGPELTQQEFVARANSACADLARKNARLEPPIVPYDLESESFFKSMHDNLDATRERLAALNPPAAAEDDLRRLILLYERVGAKFNSVEAAASTDQDPEVKASLAELRQDVAEIAGIERRLGICPRDSSLKQSIAERSKATRADPNEGVGGELDL